MESNDNQPSQAEALGDKIIKVGDDIKKAAKPALKSPAGLTPVSQQGNMGILNDDSDSLGHVMSHAGDRLRELAKKTDEWPEEAT